MPENKNALETSFIGPEITDVPAESSVETGRNPIRAFGRKIIQMIGDIEIKV